MKQISDIKKFKGGNLYSLIGQQIKAKGALRFMKGGTMVMKSGQWNVYYEDLNTELTIVPTDEGTAIAYTFQSKPNDRFRKNGNYPIGGTPMRVEMTVTGQVHYTDDTSEPYRYSAYLSCDGQAHSFKDTTSIPADKKCHGITVDTVFLIPQGMAVNAYMQKETTVNVEPLHFTADAFVFPAGAGTATATPPNPTYGQIVTFTATDAPGYTFTGWLESGKTERSYSVRAYGNIRDTAAFSDTSNVVDFFIRVYMDSSRHICAEARTLQNRSNQFVMVSFTLTYTDTSGMTRTLNYEREVYLNGTLDNHTFSETASYLDENTKPTVGTLPNPLKLGNVEVVLDNGDMLMTQSLKAGYSLWEITADDDDG